MDLLKKTTVVKYINAIWGQTIDELSDLKSGHFYLHVLGLLDDLKNDKRWNTDKEDLKTDEDRLVYVKTFLQDYYGEDVKIEDFLKFDTVISSCGNGTTENDLDLELAKIAVVLIGIGMLDSNRQYFISSGLQLPLEMHTDVMAIIQSVVQAGSSEVALTDNIEKVLREPSDSSTDTNQATMLKWLQTLPKNSISLASVEEQIYPDLSPIKPEGRTSPPVCCLQKSHFMEPSQTSTPKEARITRSMAAASGCNKDSPLRTNTSILNYSLQDITSPLRGLNINTSSPSSPLAQFVQSPQLLQKAIIRQKELEIRKLKQQLSDQTFLKDELQLNLHDQISDSAKKDAEILKLQNRIKELLHLKDGYDERQELKLKNAELEAELQKLNLKLETLHQYKEQCQILEKESSRHCGEVEKLHEEIKALEMENSKHKEYLKTISQLKVQIEGLEMQIETMNKAREDWEGEREAMQGNLEMAKDAADNLKHELEELQAKQHENAGGESMGIFLEMQMGELRCQLEEVRQERDSLLEQLNKLKNAVSDKDGEIDKMKSSATGHEGEIKKLEDLISSKDEMIEKLQGNVQQSEEKMTEMKDCIGTLEAEVTGLKELSHQKDEQLQELSDLKDRLEDKVKTLDSDLMTKTQECKESTEEVSSLTVKISDLEKELLMQCQETETISEAKTKLEEAIRQKEEDLENMQKDLDVKVEALAQLQTEKDCADMNLKSKEEENVALTQTLAKHKEETEEVMESLQEKTRALEDKVRALDSDLMVKTQECKESTEEVSNLTVKISDLEKELQVQCQETETISEAKTKLEEAVRQKEEDLENMQKDLVVKVEALVQLQTEKDCADMNLKSKEEENVALTQTLAKHQEEMVEVRESLQEKTKAFEDISEVLRQTNAEFSDLQEKEKALAEANMNLEQRCEEMKMETDRLGNLVADKEEQLVQLRESVSDGDGRMTMMQEEIEDLRKTVGEARNECAGLQVQLSQKTEELSTLQTEKDQIQIELCERDSKITTLTTEVGHFKQVVDEKNNDCTMKDDKIQELTEQIKNLETNICQLREELNDQTEQCTASDTKLADLTSQVSTLQSELSSKSHELEQVTSDLTAKHQVLCEVQSEKESVLNDLHMKVEENKVLTDNICKKDCELQELQEQNNMATTKIAELQQRVSDSDNLIMQLNTQVASLTMNGDEQQNKMAETIEELHRAKEHFAQLAKDKEELASNFEVKNAEVAELSKEIEEMKQNADIMNNRIEQSEQKCALLSEELSKAQEEKVQLQEDLDIKSNQVSSLEDKFSCLEQENTSMASKFEELQIEFTAKCEELTSQQAEKEALDTELKSKVTELNERLEESNRTVAEKEEQISKMQETLTNQTKMLEETQSDYKEMQTLKAERDEEVAHLKEKLVNQSHCLQEAQDQVSMLQQQVSDQKTETEQLIRDKEAVSCELQAREEEVACLKKECECKEEELVKTKEEVTDLKETVAEMEELKTRNEEKSHKIALLEEKMTAVSADMMQTEQERQTEIASLKEHIKQQQVDLHHRQEELLDKTRILESVLSNADSKDTKIAELTSKLDENVKSVTELQENVNKKDEEIKQLSETIKEQNSSIDELTVILQSKESSLSEVHHQLEDQASAYKKQTEELENKTAELAELSEQHKLNSKQLQEMQSRISDLEKELEEKDHLLQNVNTEVESKTFSLQEREAEHIQLVEDVKNAQEVLTQREAKIQQIENQLEELNLTLQQRAEEVAHKDEIIASKDATLQDKESNLNEITSTLEKKAEEIAEKDSVIDSLKKEHVSELAKLKEETTHMLEDLHVKFEAAKESEIKALADQKSEFETQMADLKSQHQAQLAEAHKQHTEALANLESQTKEIGEARERENVSFNQEIESLKAQYETKIQAIAAENETKLQQLYEDLKQEQQAQREMEQELSSQRKLATRLEEAVRQEREEREQIVQKVMEENDRKISTMEHSQSSKITQLMEEKTALAEERTSLEEKVTDLQETVTMVQKEFKALEVTKKDLECQIITLKEEHERSLQQQRLSLGKEIQGFQTILNAKTQEIEQLVSDVESMREQLAHKEEESSQRMQEHEDLQMKYDSMMASYEEQMSQLNTELQEIQIKEREYKSAVENMKAQNSQYENKCKSLQEENKTMRERENKRLKESDAQMRTANEFCNDLRKQLDAAKEKLETSEKEMKNSGEQVRRHEQQMAKMKETNASLSNALKIERDTNAKMQKRMESYTSKYEDMKIKYDNMLKENKAYAAEVNRLKTALDYSDRKLREYQHQLDQAGAALLGDASHFKQLVAKEEYDSLDDSIISKSSAGSGRMLRSRSRLSSGSNTLTTSPNETIISADAVMLRRETLASAAELQDKKTGSKRSAEDRMSICSASSSHSVKSLSGIPVAALPNAMSCANEPDEFEWDRLSELQRRNTMYPAHLKSAYPVEMQIVSKNKFSDDSLRLSLAPDRKHSPGRNSTKAKESNSKSSSSKKPDGTQDRELISTKRKAPVKQITEDDSGESPPKQVRTAPVYKKPGPPTPGKQPRRISGKFTPSHGISPGQGSRVKALGSPIARPNPRRTPSKRTPRRSPRQHPQTSPDQTEDDDRRESVAFSIGFTPKKKSGPGRLLRQKGFLGKSKSSSKNASSEQEEKTKTQQTKQVSFSTSCKGDVQKKAFVEKKGVLSGLLPVDLSKDCDTILALEHKTQDSALTFTKGSVHDKARSKDIVHEKACIGNEDELVANVTRKCDTTLAHESKAQDSYSTFIKDTVHDRARSKDIVHEKACIGKEDELVANVTRKCDTTLAHESKAQDSYSTFIKDTVHDRAKFKDIVHEKACIGKEDELVANVTRKCDTTLAHESKAQDSYSTFIKDTVHDRARSKDIVHEKACTRNKLSSEVEASSGNKTMSTNNETLLVLDTKSEQSEENKISQHVSSKIQSEEMKNESIHTQSLNKPTLSTSTSNYLISGWSSFDGTSCSLGDQTQKPDTQFRIQSMFLTKEQPFVFFERYEKIRERDNNVKCTGELVLSASVHETDVVRPEFIHKSKSDSDCSSLKFPTVLKAKLDSRVQSYNSAGVTGNRTTLQVPEIQSYNRADVTGNRTTLEDPEIQSYNRADVTGHKTTLLDHEIQSYNSADVTGHRTTLQNPGIQSYNSGDITRNGTTLQDHEIQSYNSADVTGHRTTLQNPGIQSYNSRDITRNGTTLQIPEIQSYNSADVTGNRRTLQDPGIQSYNRADVTGNRTTLQDPGIQSYNRADVTGHKTTLQDPGIQSYNRADVTGHRITLQDHEIQSYNRADVTGDRTTLQDPEIQSYNSADVTGHRKTLQVPESNIGKQQTALQSNSSSLHSGTEMENKLDPGILGYSSTDISGHRLTLQGILKSDSNKSSNDPQGCSTASNAVPLILGQKNSSQKFVKQKLKFTKFSSVPDTFGIDVEEPPPKRRLEFSDSSTSLNAALLGSDKSATKISPEKVRKENHSYKPTFKKKAMQIFKPKSSQDKVVSNPDNRSHKRKYDFPSLNSDTNPKSDDTNPKPNISFPLEHPQHDISNHTSDYRSDNEAYSQEGEFIDDNITVPKIPKLDLVAGSEHEVNNELVKHSHRKGKSRLTKFMKKAFLFKKKSDSTFGDHITDAPSGKDSKNSPSSTTSTSQSYLQATSSLITPIPHPRVAELRATASEERSRHGSKHKTNDMGQNHELFVNSEISDAIITDTPIPYTETEKLKRVISCTDEASGLKRDVEEPPLKKRLEFSDSSNSLNAALLETDKSAMKISPQTLVKEKHSYKPTLKNKAMQIFKTKSSQDKAVSNPNTQSQTKPGANKVAQLRAKFESVHITKAKVLQNASEKTKSNVNVSSPSQGPHSQISMTNQQTSSENSMKKVLHVIQNPNVKTPMSNLLLKEVKKVQSPKTPNRNSAQRKTPYKVSPKFTARRGKVTPKKLLAHSLTPPQNSQDYLKHNLTTPITMAGVETDEMSMNKTVFKTPHNKKPKHLLVRSNKVTPVGTKRKL